MTTAPEILQAGIRAMQDRAATRDSESERSMRRAVDGFNALTGHQLTERDGWQFMEILKIARSRNGGHNPDDYVDGAAYAALAGEAAHEASLNPYEQLARRYASVADDRADQSADDSDRASYGASVEIPLPIPTELMPRVYVALVRGGEHELIFDLYRHERAGNV
ncbi:MAG: DUF6378 domain-containing protein [Algiphilus sp.]|uniref:DUF6378 domain-containing protein n=1 Tax=Algiphilus sp. TaxID=1872431 RepID=UPI0032F02ED2